MASHDDGQHVDFPVKWVEPPLLIICASFVFFILPITSTKHTVPAVCTAPGAKQLGTIESLLSGWSGKGHLPIFHWCTCSPATSFRSAERTISTCAKRSSCWLSKQPDWSARGHTVPYDLQCTFIGMSNVTLVWAHETQALCPQNRYIHLHSHLRRGAQRRIVSELQTGEERKVSILLTLSDCMGDSVSTQAAQTTLGTPCVNTKEIWEPGSSTHVELRKHLRCMLPLE